MSRNVWRACGALGTAMLLAMTACRRDRVPVEELYTTRALGLSYLQRNQLSEAEVEFRKLVELAPDDPLGYASLGLTYLQAGRYADAEKHLDRARKLDPASVDVRLALARLYSLTGRTADAGSTLEQLRRDSTTNAHVLYALASLEQRKDTASVARYEDRLRDVLAVAPANLVARLDLAASFAGRGAADSAVRQLEEVRRIPPAPPKDARVALDSAIGLLRAAKVPEARAAVARLMSLMEVTTPYQASMDDVRWTEGPIAGRPVLTFAPKDFISIRGLPQRAAVDVAKFVDATGDAGFPVADITTAADSAAARAGAAAAVAAGDIDGDGIDDLFVAAWSASAKRSVAHLYRVQGGFVRDDTPRTRIALPQGAMFATFADVDNDGWLDLFAIGGDGHGYLFRNQGDGTFADASAKAGVGDVRGARKALFVDLDHDGDLDLLLLGAGPVIVERNNLDGTFTDVTMAFGLGGITSARDAAFADIDGDGRIDVLFARDSANVAVFLNGGADRFRDASASSGIGETNGAAIAIGDYDNDGFLDVAVASGSGGETSLWRNTGDGTFARDSRSSVLAQARAKSSATMTFLDFDNDGWLDLMVAWADRGTGRVQLFRNDRTGKFIAPAAVVSDPIMRAGASALVLSDIDSDGDEDVLAIDAVGQVHLLRNDLGNSNLAVNVELKGLRDGSGKNNALGIGARLELRAGEIYQTRVATSRVTHFGLGGHLKADVLRIEWPNGVPQTVYFPGSDQDVVEREMLKGSCAFAYTWDGTRFRFVTDAMWRSALGMPLGLMGGASAFAPAGASQEYVRIPGEALKPRNGRYVLQLTEELWETAYADEVKLVAVDHPDSVDVFVDERFVPPGPVSLTLHQVARRTLPRTAVDERGRDVLPALRESDDVYVSDFTPTRYQGVVESHDLVMDLGPDAGRPHTFLFLRGWIYPTDASINVALSQQTAIRVAAPSLEVRGGNGEWRVAIPSLGFPSGKDKTMIVDLAGRFPTADHRVRIRTNMQIYWDQAFVSSTISDSSVKTTPLAAVSADLHFRGYSRMYRKGGRYGPYWFAYGDVSTDAPWRPIEGRFTRFGDVLPLLRGADDMYVIMAPGDETTIEFDASSENALPKGWKRDFLLYTDGWIKDSDLNTAHGTTVGPLPYHGVTSYPYAQGDAYPGDSAHQRYLRGYDTRVVERNAPRR